MSGEEFGNGVGILAFFIPYIVQVLDFCFLQ